MGSSALRASSPYHLKSALIDGAQHGGVAILLSCITLTAPDDDQAKALIIYRQLKGVGLDETNERASERSTARKATPDKPITKRSSS
jgi:hypothetical protein